MGILRSMKKKLIINGMEKRKKQNPFDIEAADNFVMNANADELFNHSQYFTAHSFTSSECLFFRLAKRGGDAPNEVWFVYRDKDNNLYMAQKDHVAKNEFLSANIECVKAGKTLKFSYRGKVLPAVLKEQGYFPDFDKAPVDIDMNAEFDGTGKCFEFSTHMSSELMGNALCVEKFSKSFKNTMKAIHQTHFEQSGTVTAQINFLGKTACLQALPAIRDHSFGNRDWDFFNRYIWIVGLLENGDFFHTSMMRYPNITQLQAGFYESGENIDSLIKATSMDDIPVIGNVPKQFEFVSTFVNGETKNVECKLDFVCPFSFSNGNFTVNEGVSEFLVNGIRGRGITEFAFNTDSSRWYKKTKD